MAKAENGTKKRGRPAKAAATAGSSAPPSANGTGPTQSDALVGFEAKLWLMADKLRNNMDAGEYKHVVLGLIFLEYVSDPFEEKHAELEAATKSGADPEDPDEYRAENIFWVPKEARWTFLQGSATQPTIGKLLDDAMVAIERDNATLEGVLPKDYARPALDKASLGGVINLVGQIGLGDKANRSRDVLGRVYEYFLTQFASAEGKNGGQFYTPRGVVQVLVEMLAPYKGRVLDPCCGSGGMFVSSEKFVEAHGGRIGDVSIYGQESNHKSHCIGFRLVDAAATPCRCSASNRPICPSAWACSTRRCCGTRRSPRRARASTPRSSPRFSPASGVWTFFASRAP